MTRKHLSPEIVSLIHHVELNESGWWKKAIGQVIKGVLWKASKSQTVAELKGALVREVGVSLPEQVIEKQLNDLSSLHAVTILPGPLFKLTEQERQALTESQAKAASEQEECQSTFISSCARHCPGLEAKKVWEQFQRSLVNAIEVTGANLFHLLADGNLEREVDWVARFLSRFDSEEGDGLHKVLSDFFSPSNHACRNQVLRRLTAHFFAEASQLRPETLAVIERKRAQRTIKVVLDTNIIFSVLQLHDNPGDDSAISLVDIAQRTGSGLEVKLYVLPGTLDEATRTLAYQMELVDRVRTTSAMARAALRQPLPSIAKKFFAAAAASPGLSARTFFQPYIDDLQTILRDKGIAVLDANPATYNQRQDVVDDVLDEVRREEREVPEPKRKGYETHLHDVVLWHAVQDRRREHVDSPFDIEYWAVSIDWRLITFDRKKRSTGISKLPLILHPSNLIQLVQFWVPRTKELEDSLVDSLRLPIFFQSFDPEDERATVQVLQALSRYENVGDLAEETVSAVLANRALRGRLKEADASNDEVFALVREELLSEHKAALASLDETKGRLGHVETALELERKRRDEADSSLRAASHELTEAQKRVQAAEQRAADAEQARLVEVKKALQREEEAIAARVALIRIRYALGVLLVPALLGVALGVGGHVFLAKIPTPLEPVSNWAATIALGLTPMALAFYFSPYITQRYPALQDWQIARTINWFGKKAIAAPMSLAVTAIYQGGIWDGVKALFGGQAS